MINYIFTITAGRSGQATLHGILQKYANECLSEFESPSFNTRFGGTLGVVERKIRRTFFETDELLGRGKVLQAYRKSDFAYIEKIVAKKLKIISHKIKDQKINTYFDISKFYARGLYVGFNKILENFSVILLVRDPLLNMRSFLNRNKNFFLDNDSPNSENNLLKLNVSELSKGELYLWSWSEMVLRYKKIIQSNKVKKHVVINSDDLLCPNKIKNKLGPLGVELNKFNKVEKKNTNIEIGIPKTAINYDDVFLLERFISRLPEDQLKDLGDLESALKYHQKNLNNYN